jgi:DNA-binding NarL/FixJ family response regulator
MKLNRSSGEIVVPLIRILVVDDAQYWKKFLLFLLRADPIFEVVGESSDGLKAIQMAQQLTPTVVLMDIGLPGLDGLESASRILKLLKDIKIVFVTQETDPEVVATALGIGASGYVVKSDAGRELESALYAVMQGKIYVSRGLRLGSSLEQ